MLIRIVSILFPLFAITALGYFVGRRMKPDLSHANKLNMDVFVPALVFGALVGKDFRLGEYLPLLFATVVIIVGSGVAGWLVARAAGIATKTLVPPMMFNNCGNLGLPLAVLAFGESALAPAVVMFVVSNVIHFSYGAWLLDHHTKLSTVWRSPSILATIAGLAVGFLGIEVWPPLLMSIEMVGDISIPLMLFALGVRLADSRISAVGFGLFGAVLRPVVGMALAWALLQMLELPPREQALLLVFGALPPAVLNYMFAERYDQEPDKVASMVLIGNLAAVVFLPIALALVLD
ncbi:MAG TPA: AEC family transporter [Thauera aminoaromatica]|uniref:AEC family transporter n=1 Tax=Thauera sp. TaxID=1905334 RepID=UPI00110E2670|nr:AEC family transporter [Thauera sp.]TMW72636.1 AEC family transporter [Thauera sp. UPWRP]HMV93663.1 AEC family transporter [Thauera aminoaromatica]MBP6133189.1 AEC family transporter [Thauera sp.]MBP7049326.1 AEC family transporter [Thauera sp.]HMX12843.1 AEC family transporter [Thauera aminoaromatica]